jgi:hypothetical protein
MQKQLLQILPIMTTHRRCEDTEVLYPVVFKSLNIWDGAKVDSGPV